MVGYYLIGRNKEEEEEEEEEKRGVEGRGKCALILTAPVNLG